MDDRRPRPWVDPTQALFAAARTHYLVVRHAGETSGKEFTTQAAAEEYARRTNGVVRPV